MASRLTSFVSNYLYEQRIRQDSLSVERLASTVAPLFQSVRSDALDELLMTSGGEMGGRLMVLDNDGKVQYDSFSSLMGARLQLPEVLTILTGGENTGYGIHRPSSEGDAVAYCAARLTGTGGTLGVLLYASTVTEMMDSLQGVERQMIMVFAAMAVVAVVLAFLMSHVLTRPITAMTRTIDRMGQGDLSVRVPVQGSKEIWNLAKSYNTMAEQLETLDKSRNQFVSNASHELKTPMTTMKILLENVIYQPDMPAEMRTEFLQDMNHEIDRLTNIISDLLTLTRMDSKAMELNLSAFDFSESCEDTLRLLRPQAEKRSQRLTGKIDPAITLTGDKVKLEQVIYNLVENAIKYTPDGGAITVTMNRRGGQAVLSVRDNGVGIPEADQKHIFERFYRVDKARSRETGGTGLGLSIVRQLVALHGGTITVDSQPGSGSTFTVKLPLRQNDRSGKEGRE